MGLEHLYDYIVWDDFDVCFCGAARASNRRSYCSYTCMALDSKAAAYGIDGAAFLRLLRFQAGRCALCDTRLGAELARPVIDHDHLTGRVRGLLCQSCNLRVGALERGFLPAPRDEAMFRARIVSYLTRAGIDEVLTGVKASVPPRRDRNT